MKFLVIATLCWILFLSCRKREIVSTIDSPLPIANSHIDESSLNAAKVVGYRFASPDHFDPSYSLITQEGRLDFATLERLKLTQATLTSTQVSRLVDAVYGPNSKTGPSACYDPHHIFLFYNANGLLVNVVEVCFGCKNLNLHPEISEQQWSRHDFRELARICDEAGIGMESGTAEDQIRFWDEQEREFDSE
jgi:hypothetical protein